MMLQSTISSISDNCIDSEGVHDVLELLFVALVQLHGAHRTCSEEQPTQKLLEVTHMCKPVVLSLHS